MGTEPKCRPTEANDLLRDGLIRKIESMTAEEWEEFLAAIHENRVKGCIRIEK